MDMDGTCTYMLICKACVRDRILRSLGTVRCRLSTRMYGSTVRSSAGRDGAEYNTVPQGTRQRPSGRGVEAAMGRLGVASKSPSFVPSGTPWATTCPPTPT